MYAVIKTGGKQYRVSPGDKLRVESLAVAEGESVDFDQILMVSDGNNVSIGNPHVSDAVVTGKVVNHGRGDKVRIVKFRRRKHHRKQMGHRQNYTELEIVSINGVTAPASSKDSAKAKSSGADSSSKAKSVKTDNSSKEASSAAVAAAAVAPKFLDAPNGEPDDLKKILGIGPVLEEKLNEMGIYHYSQIAEFSDTDVANINTHLNFPGRIERDEWIAQAKNLADGGEPR